MSQDHKHREDEQTPTKPFGRDRSMTITPEWKLPLYVVVPIVGLAIIATRGFYNINTKLDNMVSRSELRSYMENISRKNPTLTIPEFPASSLEDSVKAGVNWLAKEQH